MFNFFQYIGIALCYKLRKAFFGESHVFEFIDKVIFGGGFWASTVKQVLTS